MINSSNWRYLSSSLIADFHARKHIQGTVYITRQSLSFTSLYFSVNIYILHKIIRFMPYKPHLYFIKNLVKKVFSRFCRHTVTSPECQLVTCDRSISFLSHSCHAFIYLVTAMWQENILPVTHNSLIYNKYDGVTGKAWKNFFCFVVMKKIIGKQNLILAYFSM